MKSKKPEVDKRDVAVISNSKCGNNLTAFIPSLFTYQKIYAVSDYFDSVDAEESLQGKYVSLCILIPLVAVWNK